MRYTGDKKNSSAVLLCIVALALAPMNVASLQRDRECAPEQYTQQLWEIARKGDLFSQQAWQKTNGYFLHPTSWPGNGSVRVFSNHWRIVGCTVADKKAEVVVEAAAQGHLDGLALVAPQQIGAVQLHYHFVLAPTHWHTFKPDGSVDKEMTGPEAWQIVDTPESPWTTINTAIRYLLEKRRSTTNPAWIRNADESIAQLLKIEEPLNPAVNQESPIEVVKELWTSGTNGELLTPGGQKKRSQFFTQQVAQKDDSVIHIMNDEWGIQDSSVGTDKATVTLGYSDAGRIDSSLRYFAPEPSPFFKTGFRYSLAKISDDHPKTSGDGSFTTHERWRIEGPPNIFPGAKWTTVNTAIRYILDRRSKTTDPAIRKNADAAIAALLKYR